jgi:hypothetical protein
MSVIIMNDASRKAEFAERHPWQAFCEVQWPRTPHPYCQRHTFAFRATSKTIKPHLMFIRGRDFSAARQPLLCCLIGECDGKEAAIGSRRNFARLHRRHSRVAIPSKIQPHPTIKASPRRPALMTIKPATIKSTSIDQKFKYPANDYHSNPTAAHVTASISP